MSKAEEYFDEHHVASKSHLCKNRLLYEEVAVYQIMEQFAEHRIKQEREKWEKELEELRESEKNGRDWFEAYMYLEAFISDEINKSGNKYPIVSDKHPYLNTIEAIKLLQQPSKTKH